MRRLNEFSAAEWCRLLPLVQGLKESRNDLLLAGYRRRTAVGQAAFMDRCAGLKGQAVGIVIAFEQPWTLDWQLEQAAVNLPDVRFLVFDNSRSDGSRAAIARVCEERGVAYLGLPPYRTRHANRSHGMAMSWIFHNVVRPLQPRAFAFLDHDLIPVAPAPLFGALDAQPVFGLLNSGCAGYWNLWAGYCTFRLEDVADMPGNFLYDFSRGLDTGGRNWDALYSRLDRSRLKFAPREFVPLRPDPECETRAVELIDDAWVHIGGVGYGDNFKNKFEFFSRLRKALDGGARWQDLRAPGA